MENTHPLQHIEADDLSFVSLLSNESSSCCYDPPYENKGITNTDLLDSNDEDDSNYLPSLGNRPRRQRRPYRRNGSSITVGSLVGQSAIRHCSSETFGNTTTKASDNSSSHEFKQHNEIQQKIRRRRRQRSMIHTELKYFLRTIKAPINKLKTDKIKFTRAIGHLS